MAGYAGDLWGTRADAVRNRFAKTGIGRSGFFGAAGGGLPCTAILQAVISPVPVPKRNKLAGSFPRKIVRPQFRAKIADIRKTEAGLSAKQAG